MNLVLVNLLYDYVQILIAIRKLPNIAIIYNIMIIYYEYMIVVMLLYKENTFSILLRTCDWGQI